MIFNYEQIYNECDTNITYNIDESYNCSKMIQKKLNYNGDNINDCYVNESDSKNDTNSKRIYVFNKSIFNTISNNRKSNTNIKLFTKRITCTNNVYKRIRINQIKSNQMSKLSTCIKLSNI